MFGTAIVVTQTPTEIIIGADGKLNSDVGASTEPICKILQVGRVFFALAGLNWSNQIPYDAVEIATNSILDGGNILEITNRFLQSVWTPLYDVAEFYHETDPGLYERMTGDDSAILYSIFFGIENDRLLLTRTTFEPMFESGQMWADPEIIPENKYFACGHTTPIKVFLDQHRNYFDEVGDVNAITHLLQLAIDDRPDLVGYPIAILRLSKEGSAEWVVPSPCCPPIKSY